MLISKWCRIAWSSQPQYDKHSRGLRKMLIRLWHRRLTKENILFALQSFPHLLLWMQRFLSIELVKLQTRLNVQILTLNICNALLQDLLKNLGIFELFLDLQWCSLTAPLLADLTCPRIETHESRTDFASAARAVVCSSSKALASELCGFSPNVSKSLTVACHICSIPLRPQRESW